MYSAFIELNQSYNMGESSSFSSLLALVESHLSKTNLQESRSEVGGVSSGPLPLPTVSGAALSDIRLPSSNKMSLPKLSTSGSPITNLLAEQVSNMLKAKELKKKQEEDEKRLLEQTVLKSTEDPNNCIIDLMQALQAPLGPRLLRQCEDETSSCDSLESLFDPKFTDDVLDPVTKTPEPLLPCTTDMSYILKVKVRKGKCSAFGKVLTSRMRPVAAPYLHEEIHNPSVARFMFTTPSPCDLIKAKLELPFCHQTDR